MGGLRNRVFDLATSRHRPDVDSQENICLVKLRLCPDQDAQVQVSGANIPPQPAGEKAEDIREASTGILGWRWRPPSVTGDWSRPPNLCHDDGIDQATQCQSGR